MKTNNRHDRVRASLRVENLESRRLFKIGGGLESLNHAWELFEYGQRSNGSQFEKLTLPHTNLQPSDPGTIIPSPLPTQIHYPVINTGGTRRFEPINDLTSGSNPNLPMVE